MDIENFWNASNIDKRALVLGGVSWIKKAGAKLLSTVGAKVVNLDIESGKEVAQDKGYTRKQ